MRSLLEPYFAVLKYYGMKWSKDPFYELPEVGQNRVMRFTEAIAYSGIRPLAHRFRRFGSAGGDPFGKGWQE